MKAPSAPNPYQVANAQTQSNIQTAQAQAAMNAPLGNVSNAYGTNTVQTNAQGLPTGQTSTLSAPLQGLFNQQTGNAGAIGGAIGNLASNLPQGLNIDYGNTVNNAAQAAYGAQTGFLQPQFQLQQTQLDQQLADRGLPIGSEAYNNAQNNLTNSQNLAYTQAANNAYGAGLQAQQQGFNQGVTQNQLGYADLASLSSINPTGSLLGAAPGAANLSPSAVQPTNVGQIVQNSYQDQLAANQYNNSQLGAGLLGLGNLALSPAIGAGLGLGGGSSIAGAALGFLSDRRIKRDIKRIGTLYDGTPVYSFRYDMPNSHIQIGVMAQDVEKKNPDAVTEFNGLKMVNYEKVAVRAEKAREMKKAA